MGMDTIELVMAFEDEFGISISDEEAEKIRTVRDTVNFIVTTIQRRRPLGICPTAHRFYQLRSALGVEYGIPRDQIRPQAAIAELLAGDHQRKSWPRFAARQGLPIPRFRWFAPPSQRIPAAGVRIRELLEQVDSSQLPYFGTDGRVDAKAVFRKIRSIISEQLGIKENQIHMRSNYINDLNAG